MEPSITFFQEDSNSFTNFYWVPSSFIFSDYRGEEIGKLTWDEGIIKFSGNIDESAKVFFNYLQQFF
jgi:hypothetical protein